MKNRPLLFVILGLFHLLEPLLKLSTFKLMTGFPLETILSNIRHGPYGLYGFFEFWLLFPLGGIALLGVKRWSYPMFVGVQIYSLYSHISYQRFSWPYYSEIPHTASLLILFVNALIIMYFLLPEVRRPFFERDLRWWEHRERFNLAIPISFTFKDPNVVKDAHILNISLSGAFINYRGPEQIGDKMRVNLTFEGIHISVDAIVVSEHIFDGQKGLGIRFKYQNIWENLHMRSILRAVARTSYKQNKALGKLAA